MQNRKREAYNVQLITRRYTDIIPTHRVSVATKMVISWKKKKRVITQGHNSCTTLTRETRARHRNRTIGGRRRLFDIQFARNNLCHRFWLTVFSHADTEKHGGSRKYLNIYCRKYLYTYLVRCIKRFEISVAL